MFKAHKLGSAYTNDLLSLSIGGHCHCGRLSSRQVVPRLKIPARRETVRLIEAWLAKRPVPRRIAERGQRGTKWTIGEFV